MRKIITLLVSMIIIGSVAAILYFITSKPASAAWFDDTYQYRKRITIGNSGSADANKKVKFDIDTATLVTAGQIQSDCDDTRFTDNNGKVLRYFLDTAGGACNGASTDYYVLYETINAGNTDIYMYYGNPSALAGTEPAQFIQSTFAPTSGPTLATAETGVAPISYWKFDEGADNTCSGGTNDTCDAMGRNDGAISNGTARKTDDMCIAGKCLEFDGSDDVVSMGSAAQLDDLAAFTASAWVKPLSSGESTFGRIISKQDSNAISAKGWLVYMGSNTDIVFAVGYNTGTTTLTCSTPGQAFGTWEHVAVSWDGTNSCVGVKIYINGVLGKVTQTATPSGSRDSDATYSMLVGNESGGTRTFDGMIDDVKLYGYVRSVDQVKTDFIARGGAEGAGATLGTNKDNSPALSNGLVSYWKMDESSGNAADSSGNATTLTNTNVATYTFGKFGNAGTVAAASSQYFTAADNANTSIGDVDATFTAWVNATTLAANRDILTKWGSAGTNAQLEYQLGYDSSLARFYFQVGDGASITSAVANSFGAPTTATWYFIVAQHDAANNVIKISVNNGKQDTASWSAGIIDNTYDLSIGRAGANNFNYWNGKIDEVRIYKRLLSSTEISNLFAWAPGPLAYYKMDDSAWTNNCSTDTVFDSSGNALMLDSCPNATGATTPSIGKFGKAADFDGLTQYFQSASTTFEFSSQITLSAWVNVASPTDTSADKHFIDKTNNNAGYGLMHSATSLTPKFKIGNGTSNVTLDAPSAFTANTWVHLAGTFDGTNMILYVNGSRVASTTHTTMAAPTGQNFRIGTRSTVSHNYVDGLMDEVKVYNYPRTGKQIVEDMNGGHPLGGSPVASQVGYWALDDQQGQTANNKGFGSGINATLGNTSAVASDDPTWKIPGTSSCKINGCLSFDGTADFAFVTDDTDLDFDATTDLTISLWVNSTSDADAFLFIKRNVSSAGYNIYLGGGSTIRFQIGDGTNTVTSTPGNRDVSDGTWHHVAMTVDRTNDIGRIYIDGVQEGADINIAAVTGSLANASNLQFGREDNGTAFLAGSLDEIKLYNGALTAEEIKIDYNNGSAVAFGGVLGTQDNEGFGGNAPVGEWKMDENTGTSAYDTSGNSNTGTLTQGPTYIPGKYGSAINFDGVNDYVTVPNVVGGPLDFGDSQDFTVSGWFKTNAVGSAQTLVAKKTSNAIGTVGYLISLSAGGILNAYISSNGSTQYFRPGATTISANTWYYFTFVFDDDTAPNTKFWLNGVLDSGIATGTLSDVGNISNTQPVVFGGESDAGSDTSTIFNGQIDDIKIYNYVRTQAQIAYEYNRGAPVVHYKFDECQGPTAYNSTVNANGQAAGNNLTITPNTNINTTAGNCGSGVSTEMWNDGTTGKFNSALGFDGDDDYAVSSANVGISGAGARSVSAWVNIANTQYSGQQYFLGWGVDTNSNFFNLGTFQDKWYGGFNTTDFATNVNATYGTWLHHTVTYDGSTIKWYINGNLIATQLGLTLNTTDTTLYVGERSANNGYNFVGSIDDVRIYNYVLSPTQIKTIMNNGAVFFGPSTGSP